MGDKLKTDIASRITGSMFIMGALLLWAGWMLLPVPIGTFFATEDFSAVHERLRIWIWMYRFHIFGFVICTMSFASLAAIVSGHEARVLIWPGSFVAAIGLLVGALASAFYYHHGAWGALEMADQSVEAINDHIEALRIDTEYVTCLVRFGRVFLGLGLLVIASSFLIWKILPAAICGSAALLGLAAMALTMGLPDDLHLYQTIFHLNTIWFLALGIHLLRNGLNLKNWETSQVDDSA